MTGGVAPLVSGPAGSIRAVESAVRKAKKALSHDHLDHRLEQAIGPATRDARAPVDAFKAITRYL